MQVRLLAAVIGACGALLTTLPSANAITMQECSAKYKAAQANGTLAKGTTWNQFRRAECGPNASAATTTETPAAAPAPASAATPAPKNNVKSSKAAAEPSGSPDAAMYPKAVDPKYAQESPGRARMHTCRDQYNANKASNANGGLRWIQKGGGYYSECNKRLKA